MRKLFGIMMVSFLAMSGCASLKGLSDDDLAAKVQSSTAMVVDLGLQAALTELPAKAAAITKDAQVIDAIIQKNVLPLFTNPSTGQVLGSAVDTAMGFLSGKVSPTVALIVNGALLAVEGTIKLPANPGTAIPDRTRKALIAAFTGISDGIRAAVPPADPAVAPAAAPADAMKLTWPKH